MCLGDFLLWCGDRRGGDSGSKGQCGDLDGSGWCSVMEGGGEGSGGCRVMEGGGVERGGGWELEGRGEDGVGCWTMEGSCAGRVMVVKGE